MSVDDGRLNWLIQAAARLCALNEGELAAVEEELVKAEAVGRFLEEPAVAVLSVRCQGAGKSLSVLCFNEEAPSREESDGKEGEAAEERGDVHFAKVHAPVELTEDNMASEVVATSVGGGVTPLEGLYTTLHHVFAPALLSASGSRLDPRLSALLSELEKGIGRALGGDDGASRRGGRGRRGGGEDDFLRSIKSPSDELRHWENMSMRSGGRGRAAEYHRLLTPLHEPLSRLADMSWQALEELTNDISTALDGIWCLDVAPPYPTGRMTHFIGLLSVAICHRVTAALDKVDFWSGDYSVVKAALTGAVTALERWVAVPEELTQEWVTSERVWEGEVYEDKPARTLLQRVRDLARLRTTHEELVRLLPEERRRSLEEEDLFAPFRSLRPLAVSRYAQRAWEEAVEAYSRRLEAVERHVAASFRKHMQGMGERPKQVLREFLKFRNLLVRPTLSRELQAEKQTLLAQLGGYMDELRSDFHSRRSLGGRGVPAGRNLPTVVNNIMFGKQLVYKVRDTVKSATILLGDLDDFSRFREAARELQADAEEWCGDEFSRWRREVEEALEDEELLEQMSGRMMTITEEDDDSGRPAGQVVVNYSERLVQLLREVRQLAELGERIPSSIVKVAREGERFYRFGVALKKIANFYNTLDELVLPSQKMMLKKAMLAFDEAITDPRLPRGAGGRASIVTWSEPSECETYLERLQTIAEAVSAENRKLRKLHSRLASGVVALMGIDLLRQQDAWRAQLGRMRDIFNGLTYKPVLMTDWRLHWDKQLYKALEAGYRMGLESLNENLAEVKAELHFSNRALGLRPPVEELRRNYYKAMRRFIAIPSAFTGFDSGRPVFRRMASSNAASLLLVYRKAEELFSRVSALLHKLQPWVTAGCIADLDAFVEARCSSIEDYSAAFEALKSRRKAADKLPDYYKVDCVSISSVAFKAAVDDQLTRLGDALLISLRKATRAELKALDTFLTDADTRLSTLPRSIAEIAQAREAWQKLKVEKPRVERDAERVREQYRLLQQTAGSHIDTEDVTARLMELPTRLANFDIALEAFDDMIEDQRETLKGKVDSDVDACNEALQRLASKWSALKPTDVKSAAPAALAEVQARLDDWQAQLDEVAKRAEELAFNCEHFGMSPPSFPGLPALQTEITQTHESWRLLAEYKKQLGEIRARDWISFRARISDLQDFAARWVKKWAAVMKARAAAASDDDGVGKAGSGKGKDGGAAAGGAGRGLYDPVREFMVQELVAIKKADTALKFCHGEPFKEEHWNQLFLKLRMKGGVRLETLTVGHFLDVVDRVGKCLAFLKDLTSRAQGEVTIREAMQDLKAWTNTAEFTLMEHTMEIGGRTMKTPLIREWRETMTALGDNQSLLQSLKESAYFKPFADQAAQFETRLAALDEYLQALNLIQRKWVYLAPIFARGALPSEQARFRMVDTDFQDIMSRLASDPLVYNLSDESCFPYMHDKLSKMLEQLERCQKALSDFLEEKRNKMPRFYFIGDDDLLEILGQSKNPEVIKVHLKKLFQGIFSVDFGGEAGRSILTMKSLAGEVVPLQSPVRVTDSVEDWLDALSTEMKTTLTASLAACTEDREVELPAYPAQVLAVSELVDFTMQVEGALRGGRLSSLGDRLAETLRDYTELSSSARSSVAAAKAKAAAAKEAAAAAGGGGGDGGGGDGDGDGEYKDGSGGDEDDASAALRETETKAKLTVLKVKSLVLDLIHNRDVVTMLADCGATIGDWEWQMQLRFYMVDGSCQARMVDASMAYTYEYQGNASKLVHTPLTDKCYLTLTQGMHMGYGGNPYGPAGTGKTESVKALGQALGRLVLVFNCDEGIDFQSMGRIFIGLVRSGAWGCFDEFNRLKEDQLSAVSQQIQVIQAAIKERHRSVELLGRSVDVDFNAGIFVTMNPAGKGYGGRSKLPDNLKALFRPVAMSKPDNELIAEVILYAEGFSNARDLGHKMVSLYSLSTQLLTPQQHYDWGLRAMKAVLNTGGKLITASKEAGIDVTAELEQELLIKAVRVNTLSKLTFADSRRFLGLVSDVFPGADSGDIAYAELEEAIKHVMTHKPFNLEWDDDQVRKMLQLKESLDQRMGCVIVGPSGCGKSTLWQVLKAALQRCGQKLVTHVMNPKSMPRQRLLGAMDPDTREWEDGVLTAAARAVVKEPISVRSWIVCDGDVDPEWIESLNSVLDDNHLLTLPNGERINFGPNVNFLFETHDLRFASPATISRMGMIFLSEEDVDVGRVVKKWLRSQPEDARSSLTSWLDDFFYSALDWVLDRDAFIVDTTKVGTVMNALSHIAGATVKSDFLLRMVRGLGGNLDMGDRAELAKRVFSAAGESFSRDRPLDHTFDGAGLSTYTVHADGSELAVADIGRGGVVPTVHIARGRDMVAPWVASMEPFILVGPEGAGKDLLLRHTFSAAKAAVTTLHCNAQTTAEHVIQKIQQSCSLFSSNSGRVYRPRDSDRLVLYLKDVNLPKPDKYNTCMLVAFLQQLITFNGFYDENLEFLGLERVQIVASMNPASTVGRHALSTRFTAIARVGFLGYPSEEELEAVYTRFLSVALQRKPMADGAWRGASALSKVAEMMVAVYADVRSAFSVDDQRHYLFTPRDLTAWVQGLLRYDLQADDFSVVVAHEAVRLFRDRLVDSSTAARFDGPFKARMRSLFKSAPSLDGIYFSSLNDDDDYDIAAGAGGAAGGSSSGGGGKADDDSDDESGGGGGDAGIATGRLMRSLSAEDFRTVVEEGLIRYEREEKDLGISLFDEVLEHIAMVDRVLARPGGSTLLVGSSGVGRRTSLTLAAHMHRMELFTPVITRDFDLKQFQAFIKEVLAKAGVAGEQVVLLLEDHQFTEDAILESVNSLLSSGEIPGLYTHEELNPLLEPLKDEMSAAGFAYRTPYDFFVSRVQANLHVALIMDPHHPAFLRRCESNPALYTRCVILWMGQWSRSSLLKLPEMELAPLLAKLDTDTDELLEELVQIHESAVETFHATPRDFMTLLDNYEKMYGERAGSLQTEMDHLKAGLDKLRDAAETVDELSSNAREKSKELNVKNAAADEAMDRITEALARAKSRRVEVEELREVSTKRERDTMEKKQVIEDELAGIKPVLEQAQESVGNISSTQLTEIRSMGMPPEAVADVLSGVLLLLGIRDITWARMRRFLGGRGVKDEIMNYDARKLTPTLRREVGKLLKKKRASFDQDTIERVSLAAAPLAAWVKANLRYAEVLERIQPLEAQLNAAVRELEEAQERLQQCELDLQALDEEVKQLKDDFKARTAEATKLKVELEETEKVLQKAKLLLEKLSGEQTRWDDQHEQLEQEQRTLPTQILLAAGFATYLAASPEDVRASTLRRWASLCDLRSRFNLLKLLSSESELLRFKAAGLPADSLSMENALVILNARRAPPFIIDPAQAATRWLQAHLSAAGAAGDGADGSDGGGSGGGGGGGRRRGRRGGREEAKSASVQVVSQGDPRFTNTVELAVRFGKTLVVTEVDGVEPYLYPLIRRDLQHQGPRWVVALGNSVIDYDENFRLYLVTRHPDPELPPDAASVVTEVNFTVTRSGLEGQLLGVTIKHEKPELEAMKSKMLKEEEDLKVQLAELEKQVLEALATSEGDILENETLIEKLTATKTKSADISASLQASAAAAEELDEQRNAYAPFARDGSTLFFLISALKEANHMYQFSLKSFLGLFQATLEGGGGGGDDDVEDYVRRLTPSLEKAVLTYVGRSLFKSDLLMFALHLVHGMHPDEFGEDEWEFFVGDLVPDLSSAVPRGFPDWAAAERAPMFRLLQSTFPRVVDRLELSADEVWRRWSRSPECEKEFPSAAADVTPFQRVLVTQTLRPDRLQSAMLAFVREVLAVSSIAPPPTSLQRLAESGDCQTPLLMITTTGVDPSRELADTAARVVGRARYHEIAMGGGQAEVALSAMRNCAEKGQWLCLKNLHLVTAWLPVFEKELNALKPHADFRLWLTAESHPQFPPILLQQSTKLTFEAPPGIKKNLQRTYEEWGEETVQSGSPVRAQLLFLLAWFHAIVQERRTYIPQGWTTFYEFSTGDLHAASQVLALALGDRGEPAWPFIHGLMEFAIYGGRISNVYDLRVLRAYLKQYFNRALLSRGSEVSPGVTLPSSASYADYLAVIDSLPSSDSPAVFGLPPNIERSVQRTASAGVVRQLKALAASAEVSSKFDRERWRAMLSPLLDLWRRLTDSSPDSLERPPALKGDGSSMPTHSFVELECAFAYDLIVRVADDMDALDRVLQGTGLLTPAIQKLAQALIAGQVPESWEDAWEGPSKPSGWLRGLVLRKVALSRWARAVKSGSLLEDSISLVELFNPGTFLNALRQETARRMGCSIDSLKFVSAWGAASIRGAELQVSLSGLLLQGADFDGDLLEEAAPDGAEQITVPDCRVAWVPADGEDPYTSHAFISVPLYYATDRERLLTNLMMPCSGDKSKWIIAGVAVFLDEA
eukprot:PLAT4386.4.p1 GENE.PLAT4386.4~~PLAT4386.4.p1  ORF type:complete len:4448 (-),score=2754.09 PLAT4386.4:79-13422(-)